MKNLMKGISLMVMFLSFQGLVSAAVEVTAAPAEESKAVVTDEQKKADELKKGIIAGETAPVAPVAAATESK